MNLSQTSPLDPAVAAALAPETSVPRPATPVADAAVSLTGDVGTISAVPASQPMTTVQFPPAADPAAPAQPEVSQEANQQALAQRIDEGRTINRAVDIAFDRGQRSQRRDAPAVSASSWVWRLPSLMPPAPQQPAAGTDATVTTASMMETADAILRQFLFLTNDRTRAGAAYRHLQRAMRQVWASPDDLQRKLNLYSCLTDFVQQQRSADLTRSDYRTAMTQTFQETFGHMGPASDSRSPRPADVQDLLDTLGYGSIREMQTAIGMTGSDVDGSFGAKTGYFLQLHLLGMAATNLNQRDRLANTLLMQKLDAAQHAVTWVKGFQGSLVDRLRSSHVDPVVAALIERQGYSINGQSLIDRRGQVLDARQTEALGRRWLAQAVRVAEEAHTDLQAVEQLHMPGLNADERLAYQDASASYRRLYAELHNGAPPAAASVQEAVTDEALRGHVQQAETRVDFLGRMRREGVVESSLTAEQHQTVQRLGRYVRRQGDRLFLEMSSHQWQRTVSAVDFVRAPASPSARALSLSLCSGLDSLFDAVAMAEALGVSLAEAVRDGFADVATPSRDEASSAQAEPVMGTTIVPGATAPGGRPARHEGAHRRVQATGELILHSAATLFGNEQDEHRQAERRYRRDVEAAWDYADAVQAEGAAAVSAKRRALRVTGQQVVRGVDGRSVAMSTNADGQVVGFAAPAAAAIPA